jgi:hypothetical protein
MLGLTVKVTVAAGNSLSFLLVACVGVGICLRHPTHFILISALLYTYIMCFSTCLLRPVVIGMQPQPDICLVSKSKWQDSRLTRFFTPCSMCWDMFETPHTLHTHSRSTIYIYNVFQHLLLLAVAVVIGMQPQPDICLVSQSKWQ